MFSLRRVLAAPLPHMESLRLRAATRALLMTFGSLIRVEGAERMKGLPDTCIFIFNHNNSLEALLAPATLAFLREGRLTSFLIDWAFMTVPGVGWLARKSRSIPVYSTTPPLPFMKRRIGSLRNSTIDQCLERLNSGMSMGIFPEGSRNRSLTHLRPPKAGLGPLILRSRVPVVPIGIDYPDKHTLGRIPSLGAMVLCVGRALHFETERARYLELEGTLSRPSRQERRNLARHVSIRVMRELGPLCGKSVLSEDAPPAES